LDIKRVSYITEISEGENEILALIAGFHVFFSATINDMNISVDIAITMMNFF